MKNNGYTIIELVIILVIISIFAAMVVPNVKPFIDNIQLKTAADRIKYQLMLAKTRTLGDSRIRCGVFFDTGSSPQRVQPFFDNATAGNQGFFDQNIDKIYMEAYKLPPTITLKIGGAGTNRSIVFHGDGSTNVHGMELSLQTNKNKKKLITVLPSTGRIQIVNP